MRLKQLFKLLGLSLIILGTIFWLRSDFWQVKKIDCRLNGAPCPGPVWAELMSLAGSKNVFLLSSSKISQQIQLKHPRFLQVKIKKQIPNSLGVEIELRKAVAAISQKESGFYLVDKDGILLEKTNDSVNLPLILLPDALEQEIGARIQDELILTTIQILYESKLRLLEPKLSQIVSQRVIEVWFKDDLQVLFSLQKNIKEQLDSLQFICQRSKIEGDRLSRVDLRFDKPVIMK